MEPLVVETSLEIGDWQALQTYLRQRLLGRSRRKQLLGFLALIGLLLLVFSGSERLFGKNASLPLLAGFLLASFLLLMVSLRQAKAYRPRPDSPLLARARMEFAASGIHMTRAGQTGLTEWRAIQAIDDTATHVFFVLDRALAYVVPKRAITSVTPDEFVARVRALREAAVNPAPAAELPRVAPPAFTPAISAEPLPEWITARPLAAPVPDQPAFWPSLKRNLITGVRTILGRKVSPTDVVPTFDQAAGLLAITIAVAAILDWQRGPSDASFDSDGLYTWALWLGLVLLACALIARVQSPAAETRKVFVIALAVAPWVIAVMWALEKIPVLARSEEVLSIVLIALLLSVGFNVARAAQGFMTLGSFFVVVLASVLLGRMDTLIWLDTRTWHESSSASEGDNSYSDWSASESLLFNEPARIAEAVDSLAPERPGTSDVYFVGFAGDGSQGVFRREALFGQKVFATSMGSGERSIELINDDDDRIAYPLGTMSGLHYALSLLASRMNASEDIVVLFLTSHGSKDDGVSVQNGGLPLNDIEPEQIRRALDASGIKWRIVIVSACYAGTFVEPLEDENTLVITAADAEHTSFGCADDRDLTYFGEAFLRDALPKATSLEGAFKKARAAIRAREKEEKLTPSNPQLYLGDAMRHKLDSLGPLPLTATR